MNPRRPSRRQAAGMSLIEVLVAFVILGLVMAVIMRINATSLRNHDVSKGYLRAVQLAESRMEQMSLDNEAASLTRNGEENGLRWQFTRQPYDGWSEARLQGLPATPVEERISVSWGEEPFPRELAFSRINLIFPNR